jgi:hypothetical protein
LASIFLFSCTEIDNYDAPASRISGNVIDLTTGKNLATGPNEFTVRLWETSWSDNPAPQDIPVGQDGTYNNARLFDATYEMQPYGGPFWPVERLPDMKLKGSLTHNFEVTPYLRITDVTHTLEGETLKLSCKLQAPVTAGLPMVRDIRPFVSLTQLCGNTSKINEYADNKYCVQVNRNWSVIGDMNTGEGFNTYVLPGLPLKSGRTYYVRIGARVNDTYQKYNYSGIFPVVVP